MSPLLLLLVACKADGVLTDTGPPVDTGVAGISEGLPPMPGGLLLTSSAAGGRAEDGATELLTIVAPAEPLGTRVAGEDHVLLLGPVHLLGPLP